MLFRNRPELAPELLRDVLHVALPAYSEARLEAAELTDIAPAEYRADLVVLLVDGRPVLGIIVEVQLQRSDRKRFTWPVYVANLRARLECPACVLVVTATDAMAAWCRQPIALGPGNLFAPLVVGPASVPVVEDAQEAERDPELAVLSAMAHGRQLRGEAIGRAALRALQHLTEDRQVLYSDLVLAALSDAARTALEALMASGRYEFQSDFARRHQATGRAEGKATALLAVLEARGLAVSADARARILACTDQAQLDLWVRKAVTVPSVEALF
jgi:hypothetical protein